MSENGEQTLGAQARSGARWAAGAYYANTVVRLVISVALARLLAPSDFGVMALAMACVGFMALVQDSGLSSALVQHPEPVKPAATTVLVLTVTGGFLLAGVSWVLAPTVAGLMGSPQVGPLLRVLGLLFTIRGLANPPRALLQRTLGFRALAGVELHHFYLALVALGIGWNFSYIGATSLLGTTHTPAEQAKVQGLNDFLVLGLVALGSFGSGALLDAFGWSAVQYAMAPALVVALIGIAWLKLAHRAVPGL